jgi:dolichol-phosphate mannosyltransferase
LRAVRVDALKRARVNLWQDWLNRYELEIYWLMMAYRRGLSVRQVPITIKYHPKGVGWTKMKPFVDWWRLTRPVLLVTLGLKT